MEIQEIIKTGSSLVQIEEFTDENGETFKVAVYDGVVMPLVCKEKGGVARLHAVKDIPYEEGDVLLCSYPKTGTHWMSNLLHFLRHDGPLSEAGSYCTPHFIDFPIPLSPTPKGLRNPASHCPPKYLPTDFLKPGRKIVLVFRNPRDAAVSMFHALRKHPLFKGFKLSWNCYIECWMKGKIPTGSFFEYYNSWQKLIEERPDLDVHIVHFEDLKKNGVYELRKMSKYLSLNRTDERLKEVLERCSMRNLKADAETENSTTPLIDKDGKSTLYRKGIIGDWKTMFTVAQNETAEKIIREQLSNSIFKYKI